MISSPYALLFPGQGVQYVGMGVGLTRAFKCAKQVFEQADDTLGLSLYKLCSEGPSEQLDRTDWAQLAVFTSSLAALAVLHEATGDSLHPAAIAGHSLGEYTALVAAGALDFADALGLVRARGTAMREVASITSAGMIAVLGLDVSVVRPLCESVSRESGLIAEIANVNAPSQVVAAGHHAALSMLGESAMNAGARGVIRLNVEVASHTCLMEPAKRRLAEALDSVSINTPQFPVIGNSSAEWLCTAECIRSELLAQLTSTLQWSDSMQLLSTIADTVVEIGPGKVLTGLMRRISPSTKRMNFGDDPAQLEQLQTIIGS